MTISLTSHTIILWGVWYLMLDQVKVKTQKRYSQISNQDCSLSCGGNLDFLELKTGERVLDLGCGRGQETILAAKLVGSSGSAVGLDLTPEMIKKATENARNEQINYLEFIVGDIEQLLFTDASFDAIISNCVINHASNKKLVYQEIYRILKLGGRMVISDAVTKIPLPEVIKNDPEEWAACFGGAITEWEYLQSIKKAKFLKIEILKRKEYLKNGFDFISLTIRAFKI